MVFSSYVKQRIVFFRAKGYKVPTIGIKYSKRTELIMHEIGFTRWAQARVGQGQGRADQTIPYPSPCPALALPLPVPSARATDFVHN